MSSKTGDTDSQKSQDEVNWPTKIWSWTVNFIKSTTIEPPIFLFWLGVMVMYGSALNTDMLIWKVCRYELGYNETVCYDLGIDEQWEDEEAEVQRRVNDIQLYQGWISTGAGLIYVFFLGAMSDHIGRKFLITFPFIGSLLAAISQIINFAYLDVLPTEFFYLESLIGLFGGYSSFHLGMYSYGISHVTHPDDMSHVLARYDGFQSLATIFGTYLSPRVYDAWGFYGTYGMEAACIFLAIIYMIFFVKEPHNPDKKSEKEEKTGNVFKRVWNTFYKYVIIGTWDTLKALTRKRPFHMRELLLVQFVGFGLAYYYYQYWEVMYLYLLIAFDITGEEFSNMNVMFNIFQTIGLLVLIPVLTKFFHVHEAAILTLCSASVAIGFFSMAYANTLLGFYFGNWALFLMAAQFGPGRSLITRSINEDEVGKVLSGNAIISALVPLGSAPAYRELYDATLETVPEAFLWMSGAVGVICVGIYVFVWTQIGKFRMKQKAEEEEEGRKVLVEEGATDSDAGDSVKMHPIDIESTNSNSVS